MTTIFSSTRYLGAIALSLILINCSKPGATHPEADNTQPEHHRDKNTVNISDRIVPISALGLVSEQAKAALKKDVSQWYWGDVATVCGAMPTTNSDPAKLKSYRQCDLDYFQQHNLLYHKHLKRSPVVVTHETLGGIPVEIFSPRAGIAPENQQRVLINLHGGGFMGGARTASHLESLPIATLGQIKVISIDYRQAPEYPFPTATDDVEAVYRALLSDYAPEQIGLYGCSAGGVLTAQSLARFQQSQLPTPGAAGIFCAGAHYWTVGTSGYVLMDNLDDFDDPYFEGVALDNPRAFPWEDDRTMANFPPTLVISSTGDNLLSQAVGTHRKLHRLGVATELHIWEALPHAFIYDPELPESREAYQVIVDFFAAHLQPKGS